jgi:hypothetical protein
MRFWHQTCCPQWTSTGMFFSTTTLGRTQFVLLLVFGRRIWHPTSSHFLCRNCRSSHSGVLFSATWILIYYWTTLASSFVGPSLLLCCTIGPLEVDADVSVMRQRKDVWHVSRFQGDEPIFVGDLGHLMLFILLSRSDFSCECRLY